MTDVTPYTDELLYGRQRPKRIRMSRQHPWRADNPDAVIVARPSKWGNPYSVRDWGLTMSLALFTNTARGIWNPSVLAERTDEEVARAHAAHTAWLHRLGGHPLELIPYEMCGRDLACWCPLEARCHSDIYLAIANPEIAYIAPVSAFLEAI